MEDSDTLLCKKLGFAVRRLDWWNVKGEHTPAEWMAQVLADKVDPIGEDRADMRSAAAIMQIARCLLSEATTEEIQQTAEYARNYLPVNQPKDEKVLSPEEAAALKSQ